MLYSTRRFVYILPCFILFLCFSVLLALRFPRLGKSELILELFVRLFDLCLFGFVGFLFLLVSGKGCGLWLWNSLDFSLTFFQCSLERCGAVVKRRTRDREVPGSIPTNWKCCFLEQETLSTLLSTGFYPGKKRATWKISTRLLNVLPSINKVDYYYYYY